MKRLVPLALALAIAGCGDGDSESAREGAYKPPANSTRVKPDNGDFILKLKRPRGDDRDAHALLVEQEPEIVVEGLNENFRLPRDITIVFETLPKGDTSPYYDPNDGNIHIPYEFLYETLGVFLELGSGDEEAIDEAVDVLEFVVYHEVGHALVDALNIPITGREEDAVDGLAASILIGVVEQGTGTVLTAADWFAGLSAFGGDTIVAEQFADVHSLDDQRFYSLLCWVYGSDPDRHAGLVKRGDLPRSRALGCNEEFIQNVESWLKLLDPWLKD